MPVMMIFFLGMAAVASCHGAKIVPVKAIPFPSENIPNIVVDGDKGKTPEPNEVVSIFQGGDATTTKTQSRPTDAAWSTNKGNPSIEIDEIPSNATDKAEMTTTVPKTKENPTKTKAGCVTITEKPETAQTTTTTAPTATTEPTTTTELIEESGSGESGSGESGSGAPDGSGWDDSEDGDDCLGGFVFSRQVNRCYLFGNYHVTWFKAREMCWRLGAALVSIQSKEENDFLKGQLEKTKIDFFIGGSDLNRKSKFEWDPDMTPMNFTDWGPNEPDNEDGYERCMELKYYKEYSRYYWNDVACLFRSKRFICETAPRL